VNIGKFKIKKENKKMKNVNWGSVEETSFDRLVPGGYVCGIVSVIDEEKKEYLKIEYDIAEGEQKNYYRKLQESKNFWGGSFIRSYKETALGFFKGFLTALEKSNGNFKAATFDNDPQKLKRLLIGLVLGEEEYKANDGEIKKRLYVSELRSVDSIRKGDFKVPELKKYQVSSSSQTSASDGFYPTDENKDDGDCPF